MKNYDGAELDIIRKAIPLYNKSKAYGDKIIAWQQLAQVYFDQNKFTEAQWFYCRRNNSQKIKN